MKKIIYGLAAVTLAVGGAVSAKAKEAKLNTFYWFQYTSTNHAQIVPFTSSPDQSGTLKPPTSDAFGCSGGNINCALGATNITLTSVNLTHYVPVTVGFSKQIDKKS